MSSSPDHFLYDDASFLPDPFPPFIDCELDFGILQEITEEFPNPVHHDQIVPPILSSSPPSHLLQNLSLYQSPVSANHPLGGAKTEECQFPLYSAFSNGYNQYFNGYNYEHSTEKIMQRSFSSRSFEGRPSSNFFFQPRFDGVMESQTLSSPESNTLVSSGQMRRVCSTGDLQMKSREGLLLSSPLAAAATAESNSLVEADSNLKGGPGRYTAEERKERIHRYRAKRTQRNFNKTIKYACRKTLADNRPRIRGRFARNDEPSDMIPKPATFNRYDDEEDLWMDNLNDEEVDEGTVRGGHVFGLLGPTHLPYYSY